MVHVLRTSLLTLATTPFSLVAGFLSAVLVGRLVGPDGSGLVAMTVWATIVMTAIADGGSGHVLVRRLPGLEPAAATAFAARLVRNFTLRLAAILLVVGLGFHLYSGRQGNAGFIGAAAALVMSYGLAQIAIAAAQGLGRFRVAAAGIAAGALIQPPAVILGILLGGAEGALAGYAMRYLPSIFGIIYLAASAPAADSSATAAQKLVPPAHGRRLWLIDLIDIIAINRIELLLLGFLLPLAEAGRYAAGLALAGVIEQVAYQLLPILVISFLAPELAGQPKKRAELLHRAVVSAALLAWPAAAIGAAVAGFLVAGLFGPAFAPASGAASVLFVAAGLTAVTVVPWAFMTALDRTGALMRVTVVAAILNMTALLVAIPIFGIVGAALVKAGVAATTLAILTTILMRGENICMPFAKLARIAGAAAVASVAALGAGMMLPGWPGLLPAATCGAAAYLVCLRIGRVVTRDDADDLRRNLEGRLPTSVVHPACGLVDWLAAG